MNSNSFRSRLWLVYLVVFAVALVPYMFVPFGPALSVYYSVLSWSGVCMMVGRLLVDRRHGAGALWLLAGCETCTAAGVLVMFVLEPSSPGLPEVLYAAGNLSGIVGMVWLVRRQMRGRDRESLLDAMIVTGGFALLCWVFLIEPARSAAGSLPAAIVAVSYPLMDLFVLALLVRLLLAGGLRNPAMRLIASAQLTFLVSDIAWAFVPPALAENQVVLHVITVGSGSVFGLFGAAALHPRFTSIPSDRALTRSEWPWLRTALLCAAVMAGPALLLAQAWQNHSRVPDAVAIAVGCVVIFALVVARLQILVGRVNAQSVTLIQQAERLRVLAAQDGLTGLANRRAWDGLLPDGLHRARRDGRPIVLAMIDLDHFKRYNDRNGHQGGDRLLKAAAAGWTTQLRAVDQLARYGGEEFVALLPDCSADEATDVLHRLREVTPDGQTFSAGIAEWDGQETAEQLVARADAALYQAKHAGRNRSIIAPPTTTVTRAHSAGWASSPSDDVANAPRVSGDETDRSAKPEVGEGSCPRMQPTA